MNVDPAELYRMHSWGGGSLSIAAIARETGLTYYKVREALNREKALRASRDGADDVRLAIQGYLGTSLVAFPEQAKLATNRRKIFACGDLHGNPSWNLLKQAIEYQPDVVLVGGDLYDSQEFSAHKGGSLDHRVELMEAETQSLRGWLEMGLLHIPGADWKIMRGNHDDWVIQRFEELVPAKLLKWVQDPLELLLHGLPRIELVNSPFDWHGLDRKHEFAHSRYMYLCGDALFSHANFTAKWSADSVQKLLLWFERWRKLLNIDPSIFIQFHTHKVSYVRDADGKTILIEPGMCCDPIVENYKFGYKTSWTPGARGALIFEQEKNGAEWHTIPESIRLLFA